MTGQGTKNRKQLDTESMNDLSTSPSYKYRRALLNSLPLWESDPSFPAIMASIQYTAVTWPRCYVLYQLALNAKTLPGCAAEVGVYRGGSARILTEVFATTGKSVNLFDTFEGMPPTDAQLDIHKQGDFSDTSVAIVSKQLDGFENYRLFQGHFPETTQPVESERFCMAHVDVDIYSSVKDCCAFFYPRLVSGGVMVFDDYGEPTCPGAKKAVDEFFFDKTETPIYIPTGQCMVFKLPTP
jgi:O-methyltransferase